MALGLVAVDTAARDRAAGGPTIGLWTLSSIDRPEGGFSHCAISAPFSNGVNLVVSLDGGGRWRLGMAHREWRLDPGLPVPLAVELDGSPPVAVLAVARTPWMILSDALSEQPVIERLRRAARMAVIGGAARFDFELNDLREAFAVLEGCAEESGRQPLRMPPEKEARRLFEELAAREGLDRMRRLPDQPQARLPDWDVVWRAGVLWGGLRVAAPARPLSAVEVAELIISDEARGCAGRFATAMQPYDGTRGGVRFHAICRSPPSDFHTRYAVVPRTTGGFYVYAVSLLGREEPLAELLQFDDRLAMAFREVGQ